MELPKNTEDFTMKRTLIARQLSPVNAWYTPINKVKTNNDRLRIWIGQPYGQHPAYSSGRRTLLDVTVEAIMWAGILVAERGEDADSGNEYILLHPVEDKSVYDITRALTAILLEAQYTIEPHTPKKMPTLANFGEESETNPELESQLDMIFN